MFDLFSPQHPFRLWSPAVQSGAGGPTTITWDFTGSPDALYQDTAGVMPAGEADTVASIAHPLYPMQQSEAARRPILGTADDSGTFEDAGDQLFCEAIAAVIDAVMEAGQDLLINVAFNAPSITNSPILFSIATNLDTGRWYMQVLSNGRIRVQMTSNENALLAAYNHGVTVITPGVTYTMGVLLSGGKITVLVDDIPIAQDESFPLTGKDFTVQHVVMNGLRLIGTGRDGMIGGKIFSVQLVF